MRRCLLLVALLLTLGVATAQEDSRVLKPNYRRIARVCADEHGAFFADSLRAQFARFDQWLSVDAYRCLYYGRLVPSLSEHKEKRMKAEQQLGADSYEAGLAALQFEALLYAVWSSGRGSKKEPLHVVREADAQCVCDEAGAPLWVKPRQGKRRLVSPRQP